MITSSWITEICLQSVNFSLKSLTGQFEDNFKDRWTEDDNTYLHLETDKMKTTIEIVNDFIEFTAVISKRYPTETELTVGFNRDMTSMNDLIADGTYRSVTGITITETTLILKNEDDDNFPAVLADEVFDMTATPNDQIICVDKNDDLVILLSEFNEVITINDPEFISADVNITR